MTDAARLFEIEPLYCIDTNVLVSFMYESDDEQYGRDAFAPQWDLIESAIADGKIIAPEAVETELLTWERQVPDMTQWVRQRRFMFQDMNDQILDAAKRIVNQFPAYGSDENYVADLEVIALASSSRLAVITNERARPVFSPARPRIPEACARFGVECLSVPGFLRREAQAASLGR